jgi:hypothetical protein
MMPNLIHNVSYNDLSAFTSHTLDIFFHGWHLPKFDLRSDVDDQDQGADLIASNSCTQEFPLGLALYTCV